MQCPQCAAQLPDEDVFCEACGARLKPATGPPACPCGAGADEIDEDGFCSRCGRRARRPKTDRIEEVLSGACAAVSDRGLRHARNEDRFAIDRSDAGFALVVCDGVSASRDSELASTAVAECVSQALSAALRNGVGSGHEPLMLEAIAQGEAALAAHPARDREDNPPSTTVVAALVTGGRVTVGWVGDSRAYWIRSGGARQLTRDHSWMSEVIESGEMTAEEAEKHPDAHAITRWLGADAGANAAADTAEFAVDGPGTLLLCTDGLWNYAAAPDAMAQLVHDSSGGDADALAVSRKLIEFAIARGGQDNVTAIVLQHAGLG